MGSKSAGDSGDISQATDSSRSPNKSSGSHENDEVQQPGNNPGFPIESATTANSMHEQQISSVDLPIHDSCAGINPCGCFYKSFGWPLSRSCIIIAIVLIASAFLVLGSELVYNERGVCDCINQRNCSSRCKSICGRASECFGIETAFKSTGLVAGFSEVSSAGAILIAIIKKRPSTAIIGTLLIAMAAVVKLASYVLLSEFWSRGFGRLNASVEDRQRAQCLLISVGAFFALIYSYFAFCSFILYYHLVEEEKIRILRSLNESSMVQTESSAIMHVPSFSETTGTPPPSNHSGEETNPADRHNILAKRGHHH